MNKDIPNSEPELITGSCGIGGCPAIYRSSEGTFFVVGKAVSSTSLPAEKVSAGEQVVEIPEALVFALASCVAEKLRG